MRAIFIIGLAITTLFPCTVASYLTRNSRVLPSTPFPNITASSTTTSLRTIYTSAPNGSYPTLQIFVVDLAAFVDKSTSVAFYSFSFMIEPDLNDATCNATVQSPHGKLNDVQVAHCRQRRSWPPTYNQTTPVYFSFAWKRQHNGTVLVLRSTNPASAHHCPDFPHDACWAQALYWVPPDDIWRINGVEVYVQARGSVLQLQGTYCKSGMPDCVWSEYLY